MNQTNTATAAKPNTGLLPALTLVAITANDGVRAALAKATTSVDGTVEIAYVDTASEVASIAAPHPVAVYCLECDSDSEQARRELGLITGLAAHAPILLVDSGHAGIDLEGAVTEGASDLVAVEREALFTARVRQALGVGRTRLELLEVGQRLNQSQRRLDVLLSRGQDARATLQESRIVDASAAFARLLGLADVEAARGLNLLDRVAPHDRDQVAEALEQVASSQSDGSLVFDALARQNHRQRVRALLQPGVDENDGGQCINIVLHHVDNSHAPLADPGLHQGLDGRMALHGVLAQASGRAKERIVGLVFVAIDNTAALREQLGLAESDLLLQEVGLFLLQNTRGEDRIFRFGAGEYVMLVERHSSGELGESTRQLHAALSSETFGDENHGATLTASIAYGTLSGGADDNRAQLHALVNTAYELQNAGGNACREYRTANEGDADTGDRSQWVTRLQQALTQDRFSLAYQGITSLAGDSQPYFDVLLRYVDDRGELVRPGEFLPAAEQADLMPDIDRWVTRRAIAVIWQQHAKDAHIALFVKLSAATIADGDGYLAWLAKAVKASPIARENLIFSFREDEVHGQIEHASRLARQCEAMAFRVALSHYGSTDNAAQVLEKMPADFIKLAPEFARQVLGGQQDERLSDIIASARERQIPLIAEQIEDANSMARLWQAGINYVQGHFIQEPDTEALANTENLDG